MSQLVSSYKIDIRSATCLAAKTVDFIFQACTIALTWSNYSLPNNLNGEPNESKES